MPGTMQITEAMEKFAGVTNESSEQHVQWSRSWQRRDTIDANKFTNWLRQRSPFNRPDDLLVSLSSGVIAKEKANCDAAVEIGEEAVKSMASKTFQDVTIRRKDQVYTIAAMGKTVFVGGEPVIVNNNQLFHRIVCIVRSDAELQDCLRYELAPRPQALFDNTSMRKGTKSKLLQMVEKKSGSSTILPENPWFVLDGGDLLHRVPWPRPATYGEVCDGYIRYLRNNYGEDVIVIFDGYDVPSTKDAVHMRRASGKLGTLEVAVYTTANVVTAQHQFLANTANKSRFVKLLGSHLQQLNYTVLYASSDADSLIVNTAIKKAKEGCNAVVVGEDTDLLVLIASLAHPDKEVHMLIPGSSLKAGKVFSSRKVQDGLGDMKYHIMFILAMTGCDTTSAPYKKGHITGYSKLQEDTYLQSLISKFNDSTASQDDIAAVGETFIVKLYRGKSEDGLDKTRFKKYVQTVGKKPPNYVLDLASLPPTSAAAREHSLRVYHQVQAWRGNHLAPTDWGWKLKHGQHIPTTTVLPPAPNHLLHLVRCNCKAGCEKNCECKKSGLKCSTMCGECAGESCSNRTETVIDDDIPIDDFDYLHDSPEGSVRNNNPAAVPKRSSSNSSSSTKRQRKTTNRH